MKQYTIAEAEARIEILTAEIEWLTTMLKLRAKPHNYPNTAPDSLAPELAPMLAVRVRERRTLVEATDRFKSQTFEA